MITNDVKALQHISVIALLKIFANKLWNSTIKSIFFTDPIEFNLFIKIIMLKGLSINENTSNDDNTKLFISSVVAHVVALHISILANVSPLAAYIENLQNYQNTFMLACPLDEKSICSSCGYIYVVVDCDNVAKIKEEEVTKCSNCKKVIPKFRYDFDAVKNITVINTQHSQDDKNAEQQVPYLALCFYIYIAKGIYLYYKLTPVNYKDDVQFKNAVDLFKKQQTMWTLHYACLSIIKRLKIEKKMRKEFIGYRSS
ncbi:hypothetical protein C2G38_2151227 [Gigaspora rosea]|uniref:Uncharacterized protein n=1 Tax=Gigaspora rosea TaxID=44941 RepID=A0A397W8J3_9GLOM|nr:hypothetical protein C2G38_2151227 [Gigaspora rosea]